MPDPRWTGTGALPGGPALVSLRVRPDLAHRGLRRGGSAHPARRILLFMRRVGLQLYMTALKLSRG